MGGAVDQYGRYPSLERKSVFVSGGSSGIGAGIVRQFATQGARVGFVGRNEAAADAVAAACAKDGRGETMFIKCDVRDVDALKAAIDEVGTAFGPITGLINNAASDDRHTSQEMTADYWDERMAVNLRHQFFAIQAVAPGMKAADGGAIVNLGSIGWGQGSGLSRLCRRQVGDRGPDPGDGKRAWARQHPRQQRGAGLDHDRAPA
jgi:NAD(P)-dependent dehydrogenase (short-subunit alcohol dehydrogenase family)